MGDEERDLKTLVDMFSCVHSIEDIASAFCKAGRDLDLAIEMLCSLQAASSSGTNHASNSDSDSTHKLLAANGDDDFRVPKSRRYRVSMGTVSGVIGKSYGSSSSWENGTRSDVKSLKLDVTKLYGEESLLGKDDSFHQDFEDFLFDMLGQGFQLGRMQIQEVLGQCGYDMKKSLETLLDQTAENLDRSYNLHEGTNEQSNSEVLSRQKQLQSLNFSLSNGDRVVETCRKSSQQPQARYEQEKEIMAALFGAPERSNFTEKDVRPKPVRRSRAFGQMVVEPLRESIDECKTKDTGIREESRHDDVDEDNYQVLRKAVNEYRTTMKEYYHAAAEAFAKGDRNKASILMEKGQFFYTKAREADEESNKRIFETSGTEDETQDEVSLDLQNLGVKEAIRLVKSHLRPLSGIPSIVHLKINIGTCEEDASRGTRERLVKKLLDKESIKWTEDQQNGTIMVRLDNINPKLLSFAKKD